MSELAPTTISPITHAPVYELVVEQLRRAIHMGTYAPGDKLPPERELAQRLEVSRASVREAVRVLEGEGYVETRRGATGGVIVLDRAKLEEQIGPYVRALLPQMEEIFEFRKAVECAAARLAAERRTDEHLANLEAALKVLEDGLETRRFRAADSQFHLGLAEAAGNGWMREAIERARAALWMPVDPHVEHVFGSAQRHHRQILEAVRARDGEAAARLMGEHLDYTLADQRLVAGGGAPE
jgi:GntR family transcriptional repressor for pyruvate dehydrogenase complex